MYHNNAKKTSNLPGLPTHTLLRFFQQPTQTKVAMRSSLPIPLDVLQTCLEFAAFSLEDIRSMAEVCSEWRVIVMNSEFCSVHAYIGWTFAPDAFQATEAHQLWNTPCQRPISAKQGWELHVSKQEVEQQAHGLSWDYNVLFEVVLPRFSFASNCITPSMSSLFMNCHFAPTQVVALHLLANFSRNLLPITLQGQQVLFPPQSTLSVAHEVDFSEMSLDDEYLPLTMATENDSMSRRLG